MQLHRQATAREHRLRASIEAKIEAAIESLDVLDGDPDIELCGDERDGDHCSEDEFMFHGHHGPGCPLGDPGEKVGGHPSDFTSVAGS